MRLSVLLAVPCILLPWVQKLLKVLNLILRAPTQIWGLTVPPNLSQRVFFNVDSRREIKTKTWVRAN